MKKMILIVLALLISFPVVATAGDAERRQLAEQFLNVNKVKDQVDMMYEKVEGIIISQIEAIEIPEEREKNLLAMQKIARDLLFEGLSWDNLKEEFDVLALEVDQVLEDDQTTKFSFKTQDGNVIETVLMYHWSKHVEEKLNRINNCGLVRELRQMRDTVGKGVLNTAIIWRILHLINN